MREAEREREEVKKFFLPLLRRLGMEKASFNFDGVEGRRGRRRMKEGGAEITADLRGREREKGRLVSLSYKGIRSTLSGSKNGRFPPPHSFTSSNVVAFQ